MAFSGKVVRFDMSAWPIALIWRPLPALFTGDDLYIGFDWQIDEAVREEFITYGPFGYDPIICDVYSQRFDTVAANDWYYTGDPGQVAVNEDAVEWQGVIISYPDGTQLAMGLYQQWHYPTPYNYDVFGGVLGDTTYRTDFRLHGPPHLIGIDSPASTYLQVDGTPTPGSPYTDGPGSNWHDMTPPGDNIYYVMFGLIFSGAATPGYLYMDNITIGTTGYGSTDILSEDWASGVFGGWNVQRAGGYDAPNEVQIVDAPTSTGAGRGTGQLQYAAVAHHQVGTGTGHIGTATGTPPGTDEVQYQVHVQRRDR